MRRGDGFTLVETLLALSLLGVGVVATAPLFVVAIQDNAMGADSGAAAALAVERMEQLRAVDCDALVAGGDLASDVTGYFDATDPAFVVRWEVSDNASPAGSKTVRVRAVSLRQIRGQPKQVTLALLRGR
jgi:prepilin-type N-terminal cleavage/methylation domain-containing protein